MGIQIKKKARSFSLDDEEFARVLHAAARHRLDRNDFLMKLVEADEHAGAVIDQLALRVQPTIATEVAALTKELGVPQARLAASIVHSLWFELKRLWLEARKTPEGIESLRAAFEGQVGAMLTLTAGNLELRGRAPSLADLVNSTLPQDEPLSAVASQRVPYGKGMTSLSEAVVQPEVPASPPKPAVKKKSRDSTQHG